MPTGTCAVQQACSNKVKEIMEIFESGIVKINCKDLDITSESWNTITAYHKVPATYVENPDGDYLLKGSLKFDMTETAPTHDFPEHEPSAENPHGFISDMKVWKA